MNSKPIKNVLIVGGGSAGLLAAITLKSKLPSLKVEVIRSVAMGHIMVGEGTVGSTPWQLHGYIGIPLDRFYRDVRPTWKKGIRFTWGPRPFFDYVFSPQFDVKIRDLSMPHGFYCTARKLEYANVDSALMSEGKAFLGRPDGNGPIVDARTAYHLENHRLVSFLETYAQELGVKLTDDKLIEAVPSPDGIDVLKLESGRSVSADLYVDCTGFRSELLGNALDVPFISFDRALFCDRALAGGWERTDEPIQAFTRADTMKAGWSWQIEHEDLINRGYVFSSAFVSDDEAEAEFRKLNPRLGDLRLIRFPTGRREKAWVKNVIGVGNASGFVEPLEATSLQIICKVTEQLTECLANCNLRPTPTLKNAYNQFVERKWNAIRDFLALHYKLNTRIETPFWNACVNDTDLGEIQPLVDFYSENGPLNMMRQVQTDWLSPFGMEGYLAMLVGMKAPYQSKFNASQRERELWKRFQNRNRDQAHAGLTVAESLAHVHSDNWQWPLQLYGAA